MLKFIFARALISFALLLSSWLVLLAMIYSVRGVSLFVYRSKEFLSFLLCVAAHAVLLLPWGSQSTKALHASHRQGAQKFLFFAFVVSLTTHIIVHTYIPNHHLQTQELMLLFSRFIGDVILFTCGFGILLKSLSWRHFSFEDKRRSGRNAFILFAGLSLKKKPLIICIFCAVILLFYTLFSFGSANAKRFLETGMLGDYVDFCGLEGLKLSRAAATGWVLPQYTHRRLLNVYAGGDKCGSNAISFLDDDEGVLIISPKCPTGDEQPKVYIERPERSEMNGKSNVIERLRDSNKIWHKELEERYGTDEEVHKSMGVRVNRDKTGVIKSVEVLSSHLVPTLRKPRTKKEEIARANWLSEKVWVVQLKDSVAYSVYCRATDYEEYHIFPPVGHSKKKLEDRSATSKKNNTSPLANVLLLVFDAVSRQEVQRSLPMFSNWLRQFRGNTSTHVFFEAQGATTLAHATKENLVPLFTGELPMLVSPDKNVMDNSLFRLVKEKYGDRFSTSYTIGDCFDMIQLLADGSNSSGFATPCKNYLDYHTFGPFCHIQYSALEGNFQGHNSIMKRCIGQQYVHEYVFNYSRALLKRRLRARQKQRNQLNDGDIQSDDDAVFFFDVLHLVEGHEGTHGVLYVVDKALTAFMEELHTELGFFDDPSNVFLVISDHGNHMGPYYELTSPGKVERALPLVGMIFHTELLHRMDLAKGYQHGVSHQNLRQRTRHISTHLDLYMTLAELFGVKGKISDNVLLVPVLPLSFFAARDKDLIVKRCEDIAAIPSKKSGCYLEWCEESNL